MVRVPRVLIAGGYGVFGRLLAAELMRTTDIEVVIAGRNLESARTACKEMDPSTSGRLSPMRVDLDRPEELRSAAEGCLVVACTAGPFQVLSTDLVEHTLAAGASWVDIADAKEWVLALLGDAGLDDRARTAGLTVGTGLSTLPALSGVLARSLAERVPHASTATVVLSVGNRNRKGVGVIASALIGGMRGGVIVRTPQGKRVAHAIDAPDEKLLADKGLRTTCLVALESSMAARLPVLAGGMSRQADPSKAIQTARILSKVSSLWRVGSSGGSVQVELRNEDGSGAAAAFVGADQWMAILPASVVIRRLAADPHSYGRVMQPRDWLSPTDAIVELARGGIRALGRDIAAFPPTAGIEPTDP
jgi:hypothetical protein